MVQVGVLLVISKWTFADYMLLIFWSYCLLIGGLRALAYGELWYHSATLYPLIWILTLVPLRSSIITGVEFLFFGFQFLICTICLVCAWTCRRGAAPTCMPVAPGLDPSPEMFASLSQLVSFSWMDDLLWSGYWKSINMDQIYDLDYDDHAYKILKNYDKCNNKKSDNLIWPALELLKGKVVLTFVYATIQSILALTPAVLIKFILEYIESPSLSYKTTAWTCVFIMLLFGVIGTSFDGQALYLGRKNAVHMRAITMGKVYEKVLKRKVASDDSNNDQVSTGSIINLMSIDANKISDVFARIHMLAQTVAQIIISMCGLYFVLGISSTLIATAVCVLSVPLNAVIVKTWMGYQQKVLQKTDERIDKTNELFQCIKIIKMFAWEDQFASQVKELRREELNWLRKRWFMWGMNVGVIICTPMMITCATFAWYTLVQGQVLKSPTAFTALTLFNLLQVPIEQAASTVGNVVEAKVSLDRINKFLNEEETEKYTTVSAKVGMIGFGNNATCSWGESSKFRLQDVNVQFIKGKLNVISGAIGSGKTSMLYALLGEMKLIKGKVYLNDGIPSARGYASSTAYCAQTPWLLNDTIRNNILFEAEYNEERYLNVIESCALKRDLEIFESGDLTQVGEKGIVLSGGQKQRIALARAVYSNADTLLLDDCLSAVDSDTAHFLYDNCLTGLLLKDRTVILVSHNVDLALSKADFAVVLKDGKVISQGSPESVKKRIEQVDAAPAATEDESAALEEKPQQLPKEEEKSEGAVDKRVYLSYLQFCGSKWFWIGLLVLFGIENIFKFGHNFWVRNWALDTENKSVEYYLSIYFAIACLAMLCTTMEIIYFMSGIMRASQRIFDKLLESVLRAESRFFDTTPLGRIMNRFSKDIEGLDQQLPTVLEGNFHFTLTALLTLFVLVYVTPIFLVFGVIISIAYSAIASFYLASSRELKRLDSVTRSPIYQHYGQTLNGVVTIRAYGHTDQFISKNLANIDYNTRPHIHLWAANRWLYFRITVMGSFVAFGAGVSVMLSVGKIDSGLAGIALTYALTFNELVLWMVRMFADLEMNMNGMERVREWMSLPGEKQAAETESIRYTWPERGEIEFKNLSLKYAPDLPHVIKDLSFKVESGAKVGIAGRTGSGKSTIFNALFRFLESDGGDILIDGVEISTVDLKRLRSSLAIIPQDPTLFSGTLRTNLDPFGLYPEGQMFEALRRVHLLDNSQFQDLDTVVTEHGQNLSQGQRQLVCLARALLKQPKILLLDEATASIDYETDRKIQQTIRQEFINCTLLTIAHRLESIMDYDMVLVMENGKMVQYDSPKNVF